MFKPDRAAGLAFAEARGFGTVCAWDGTKPVASSLPFYRADHHFYRWR
jgi:transcriptional regulator